MSRRMRGATRAGHLGAAWLMLSAKGIPLIEIFFRTTAYFVLEAKVFAQV
ncbi:hypothetical protein [Teichococcus wenyumeiae]|nr:hypothetical protein [Pseudoroseomonas wenyumeiae]